MGLYSLVGFRIDGKEKLSLAQNDNKYSDLGVRILYELRWAIQGGIYYMRDKARSIKMVKGKPTSAQIQECWKYLNMGIRPNREDSWYCLLGNAEGTLTPYMLEDLKYMMKVNPKCAYRKYIVDLDEKKYETWIEHWKIWRVRRFSLNKLPARKKYLSTVGPIYYR